MTLQVGLFVDLRNPGGWPRPPADHLARTLDVLMHAEQLGADAVWATEHHFFADGYLGQPLVLKRQLVAHQLKLTRAGLQLLLHLQDALRDLRPGE